MIYTADGQLYKQITRDDPAGLGAKFVEWDHQSVHFVICAGGEESLTIRNNFTFAEIMQFHHESTVSNLDLPVWKEKVSQDGDRSYIRSKMPAYPRGCYGANVKDPATAGMSMISFSAYGFFVATVHELYPSTVWIWSIKGVKPCAVLMQHEPVSQLLWHPLDNDLLMVTVASPTPHVYQWHLEEHPRIAALPLKVAGGGKLETKWIPRLENGKFPTFFCCNKTNFVVGALDVPPSTDTTPIFRSITEMERMVLQDTNGRVLPQLTVTKTEQANDITRLYDENAELTPTGLQATRDIDVSSYEDNADDTFYRQRQEKSKKLAEEPEPELKPVPVTADLPDSFW